MELAPGITVNGVKITPETINAEVQYHSANSYLDAKYQAMQALVIKELLLQEAANKNIKSTNEEGDIKEDEIIDILLENELKVPDLNEDDYLRYYSDNKPRFVTSPLFQVSHILYLAPPEDADAYARAKEKAEKSLALIKDNPKLFEKIAKKESACSSSGEGGRLGQISKGETMPAFEAALLQMNEGDISNAPVASEVGYHIIKLHKRAEGKELAYEAVSEKIANFLEQQKWQTALNEYIKELAQKAEISGFRFKY